jgi:uncharacterized protein
MRRSMVAAALVALAQAASADMPASLYSVGSGEVTGRYFAAAREICARANRTMAPASRCSPEPTRGSIYNLAGLRTGALSYAIVQSDWLHHAHAGSDRFAAAGPMESLRVVAPLYVEAVTIVARPGAGVAGVADLVGKRVDVGHPSSGRRATAEVVLAAAGFGIGDLAAALELGGGAETLALCNGVADAAILTVGHPSAAFAETLAACPLVIVPIAGPERARFIEDRPYYVATAIPARAYPGLDAPVPTVGVVAVLAGVEGRAGPELPALQAAAGRLANPALAGVLPEIPRLNPP